MADKEYPKVAVRVTLLNQNDKVLLFDEGKGNSLSLPGRNIKLGETAENTLRREIRAIAGKDDVYDIQFSSWQECIFDERYHEKEHIILLDYTCRTNSSEVRTNGGCRDYTWASLDREKTRDLPILNYSSRPADQLLPGQEPIKTATGIVIINPNEEVLLFKMDKWNGMYALPGGKADIGEPIENTVIREAKEETDKDDLYDLEFLVCQECIFPEERFKQEHFIFIDSACSTRTSKVTLNQEAQEGIWVPLREALQMNIHRYARKTLEEYARRHN